MPKFNIMFTTYQSFEKEFEADSLEDARELANQHWEHIMDDASAYDCENPVELDELGAETELTPVADLTTAGSRLGGADRRGQGRVIDAVVLEGDGDLSVGGAPRGACGQHIRGDHRRRRKGNCRLQQHRHNDYPGDRW